MSASSIRSLLISADSGLRDRLGETLDQIPGKTYRVEWVDSLRDAIGALTRQEYDLYFVALNGGQDEAATILEQAPAGGWAKPIIFLSEHMGPEVRCQLLRSGAAGCLRQDQLNAALLEYAIEHALEFARATRLLHQSEAEAKKLALVASRTENLVIISDPEGRIEWVNEAFTRITGYTLQEVQGAKPGSFLQGPETDGATVALEWKK